MKLYFFRLLISHLEKLFLEFQKRERTESLKNRINEKSLKLKPRVGVVRNRLSSDLRTAEIAPFSFRNQDCASF